MENLENIKNICCFLYIFVTKIIVNSERQCFLSDIKISILSSFVTNSSVQLAVRWRKEEEQTNCVPFYLIPTRVQILSMAHHDVEIRDLIFAPVISCNFSQTGYM
jgi:hypothetical protein